MIVLPIVGKFTWGAFGLGAVATVVAATTVRPLIVETVRLGYGAADLTKEAWVKAKAEAESIKAEAQMKQTRSGTEAEIQQLREEIAALRTQVSGKRASATA